MFKKALSYSPHIFALLFILAFAAFAWTEPGVAPPGGNVPAPLNVSNVAQEKTGGLLLNTWGAPNGLIVDKGNVGIGTVSPSGKLDVRGNIYTTGQGATACPIWQDCDGDGFTPGFKDCDEGCSTCYQDSAEFTCAADGFDQNCNGVIDDMYPAGSGNQCLAKTCSTGYQGGTGMVATSAIQSACQTYCQGLGKNYGGFSCSSGQGGPDSEDYAALTFSFSACTYAPFPSQNDVTFCAAYPDQTISCYCAGYR